MAYDGPERRSNSLTEDRVQLMIAQAVQQALAAHEQHLMTHMDRQFAQLRQTFSEAFPNGDPHSHRVAHERYIAKASWWDKAKGDAFSKVSSAGIWAVVVFLAIGAWEHIKNEVRK